MGRYITVRIRKHATTPVKVDLSDASKSQWGSKAKWAREALRAFVAVDGDEQEALEIDLSKLPKGTTHIIITNE